MDEYPYIMGLIVQLALKIKIINKYRVAFIHQIIPLLANEQRSIAINREVDYLTISSNL